jgi:hypothetical protein
MTIWGWDVSHFDAPDTRQAVAEDFSFFTHKAGGDANDAELNAWWVAMKPYRDQVLLGAYWVLYPDNPVARADAFLARLDTQCPGWRDGPFILQADCEKWNNSVLTVPSKMEIEFFCDRLVERMPKLKPIVYAPRWVYGEKLAGLPYPALGIGVRHRHGYRFGALSGGRLEQVGGILRPGTRRPSIHQLRHDRRPDHL